MTYSGKAPEQQELIEQEIVENFTDTDNGSDSDSVDKVNEEEKQDCAPFSDNERVPAYWHLIPQDDDTVRFENTVTGRVFEGTVAEFNIMLRG